MGKFIGLALVTILLAFGSTEAQQQAKIPRIGYVSGTGNPRDQGPYVEALRQGLRDLGHVEGRTFAIEFRGAEGKLDRVPTIVNGLSQLGVDVIVAPFPGVVQAAKQTTTTIPIVMVTGSDPVANGWVARLARPGGNITGVFTLAQDLNGKRLEILTELVPRLSLIALLWAPTDRASTLNYKEYEATARTLKVQLQSLEVDRDEPDIDRAFQVAANARVSGVITITNAALFLKQKIIAALAIKNRLPTMFQGSTWVESPVGSCPIQLTSLTPFDVPPRMCTKYSKARNLLTCR
jgi:ABC-type uncharacterized transport system substrate-binding protein